ncbi:MAG: DNA-processing protein DprA [Chthoniobacterales bacterium]
MIGKLSQNTQAILLLTAPLIIGARNGRDALLTLSEYNLLARVLREQRKQPSDLLSSGGVEAVDGLADIVDIARIQKLLGRGFLLSQAVDRWSTRAIWVISRADPSYPARLKARLREDAPPLLYGCGEPALLERGGLAVVGSRHVAPELVEYTENVGRIAASADCAVVSGAARGIDRAAMFGALSAGGRSAGVMADSLERAALSRDNREYLMDGRLVLVSPYDPAAGFNVGHAMQRNKIIYALADVALVVSSDFETGGTWAGAVEQLDALKLVPVFVRVSGDSGEGIDGLRRKGARVWPNPRDRNAFQELFAAATQRPAKADVEPPQNGSVEANATHALDETNASEETDRFSDSAKDRTHLFISYAVEDSALAEWLARKLAARGHSVWFDQMKLLGGEPWPQTIDDAIKHRTFRMLALLSKHSIKKPKPTGERTLAQRLGDLRQTPDFLIPLKIDDTELDWLTTTLSYVSFTRGWASGWRALLKKLDSISAPRVLVNSAALAAASFPTGDDLLLAEGEKVFTNVIRVKSFPHILQVFRTAGALAREDWEFLENSWAFYRINDEALVALIPPPAEFVTKVLPTREKCLWTESEFFRDVRARNIAAALIMKVLSRRLTAAGCLSHPNPRLSETFFLPESFRPNGKLQFTNFRGKKTWVQIRGKVTFRRSLGARELNYHHFAFRIRLAHGLDKAFYVQLTPTLIFFDEAGTPIIDRTVGPRRRRMTKMWWNAKWLNRLMAAEEILTSLPANGPDDMVLERGLLALSSPVAIDESLFEADAEEEESDDAADTEMLIDELELVTADE